MDTKLSKVYYSLQGYWKGLAAFKKFPVTAKVFKDAAKQCLANQVLCNFSSLRHATFLVQNLKCPTWYTKQTFFSCLPTNCLVTLKNSDKVPKPFQKIYKLEILKWPQLLQVDPRHEFMGAATKEMENHKTLIRHR